MLYKDFLNKNELYFLKKYKDDIGNIKFTNKEKSFNIYNILAKCNIKLVNTTCYNIDIKNRTISCNVKEDYPYLFLYFAEFVVIEETEEKINTIMKDKSFIKQATLEFNKELNRLNLYLDLKGSSSDDLIKNSDGIIIAKINKWNNNYSIENDFKNLSKNSKKHLISMIEKYKELKPNTEKTVSLSIPTMGEELDEYYMKSVMNFEDTRIEETSNTIASILATPDKLLKHNFDKSLENLNLKKDNLSKEKILIIADYIIKEMDLYNKRTRKKGYIGRTEEEEKRSIKRSLINTLYHINKINITIKEFSL